MAHSDFIFLCHFRLVYKLCLWLRQTDNVKENTPYLNERGESGPAQFSWRELCLLTEKKKATPIYSSPPYPLGASRQLSCSGSCPGVGMERQKCEFHFSSHLLGHLSGKQQLLT